MKRVLLIALLLGFSATTFSQISLIKTILRDDSTRHGDRFVVDLTHDRWLDVPDGVQHDIGAPGFSIHYTKDIRFGRSSFSFAIGYGFSTLNVFSNSEVVYDTLTDFSELTPFSSGYSYKKNKLNANYFTIPIELRMITPGLRSVRVVVGFKGGYLFNLHSKKKDNDGKFKWFNYENVRPYRMDAYARIGYNNFSFFAAYGLTSLFENGKGTELIPISLGISWAI